MNNYTAGDQVTNVLREKIVNGEIPDSAELTQKWVADALGVSRMPIREALLNLELEGFIERLDNRHTRVIGFGKENLASRLQFMCAIEKNAVLAIIENVNYLQILNSLSKFTKGKGGIENEIKFHIALFKLSDDRYLNQVFKKMAQPIFELLLRKRLADIEKYHLLIKSIVLVLERKQIDGINKKIDIYFKTLQSDLEI